MDTRQKISQLVIARLDGGDIQKKFKYYRSLTRQGIGGFIVFGGGLKEVSRGIKRLQGDAGIPLFIASDLEQGLGQQIQGGTLFPPAMAVGRAINSKRRDDIRLLRRSVRIMADEIIAAGFNVVFSPVLDVNTNPKNPIICTRAYSDDPEEVAWFGKELIKGFQSRGLIACAKHFPGHGDTERDSHRELPVVKAGIKRLRNVELRPFAAAVKAGVTMVMVGHLKVPALDPKLPSTFSRKIIQRLLRDQMGFKGLVITDAMNMHAVSRYDPIPGGKRQEKERSACLNALKAGANILLHPRDPEEVIDFLYSHQDRIMPEVNRSLQRVLRIKKKIVNTLPLSAGIRRIGQRSHRETAFEMTERSINTDNEILAINKIFRAVILIIDDDDSRAGKRFAETIRDHYPGVKKLYVDNKRPADAGKILDKVKDRLLIAGVFSKISAWKGRSGLSVKLRSVLKKAVRTSGYSVVAGFCCPHVLRDIKADVVIRAYSGSEQAQEAVGKVICDPE
ncbi:MAG TPA: hypothetical protein ENH31_03850 [Nitrospirae bacterium]|nr:putative lipoprotein YbbD precursor [bacterium BMS3Abin10]GBE38365.1 putative lipoprotein YbbD precursor [bacterium BMS3Bbin08]HDH50830.1 hypothetical protein [Nitrospirota bacterium]HDK16696.1 hypothetical protein [Nitrospirota bacterium]HDK81688.1 hypothetical protein [Nitrospirota bacterium]